MACCDFKLVHIWLWDNSYLFQINSYVMVAKFVHQPPPYSLHKCSMIDMFTLTKTNIPIAQ
jgi:hypothetical protein